MVCAPLRRSLSFSSNYCNGVTEGRPRGIKFNIESKGLFALSTLSKPPVLQSGRSRCVVKVSM